MKFVIVQQEPTFTESFLLARLQKEVEEKEQLQAQVKALQTELNITKKAFAMVTDTFLQKSYENMRTLEKVIQKG